MLLHDDVSENQDATFVEPPVDHQEIIQAVKRLKIHGTDTPVSKLTAWMDLGLEDLERELELIMPGTFSTNISPSKL